MIGMEPPIWATRFVEWPLPSKISGSTFHKVWQQQQQQMTINPHQQNASGGLFSKVGTRGPLAAPNATGSGINLGKPTADATGNASLSAGSADGGFEAGNSSSISSNPNQMRSGYNGNNMSSTGSAAGNVSDGTFLTGFMSRVLGPTATNMTGNSGSDRGGITSLSSSDVQYHVNPPASGCVASSNGWVVAALECFLPSDIASPTVSTSPSHISGGTGSFAQNNVGETSTGRYTTTKHQNSNNRLLRLVSRWNVRRASVMSDHWIVLPPPMTGVSTNLQNQQQQLPAWMFDYQIRQIFVDPTACHTLVSAGNGELYYIHSTSSTSASGVANSSNVSHTSSSNAFHPSLIIPGSNIGGNNTSASSNSSRQVVRLSGFGVHSTKIEWLTGVAATSVPGQTPTAATGNNVAGATSPFVQVGLSHGTYVTSVAWDRERGTEGSTKRILLGTCAGEIYEYSLTSPGSLSNKTDEDRLNGDDNYSGIQQPVLLHKLYNNTLHVNPASKRIAFSKNVGNASASINVDPTENGAAVTGLYFERLRTGILVLASTSGKQKRTRFYTFYSPHSSSFRMVLSSTDRTLQELPGSIDCADLKLCNDHFALRTATGIYFGTIDRSLSGPASLSGGGCSMIIDSGILPYDILQKQDLLKSKHSSSSMSLKVQHPFIQNHSVSPVSIAITPHHIVTVDDSNEVCFINRVAQDVIQRERLASLSSIVTESPSHTGSIDIMSIGGVAVELLMDIRRPEQVWLRKGRALVHISPSQEDRDVWKFTLQKSLEMKGGLKALVANHSKQRRCGVVSPATKSISANQTLSEEEKVQETLFEQAKTLCTNGLQKSVVTAIRAEYHVAQGRAELAAKYFAQCPPSLKPFTETAVRLALPKLGIDDPHGYGTRQAWSSLSISNIALITYLTDKMRISNMNDDKMTCTMLGAWLTELYLNERSEQMAGVLSSSARDVEFSQRALLAEFLNLNVAYMDSKTIMKILASHDVDANECSTYASKSGDIATAVNAALCVGSGDPVTAIQAASDALRVLRDAPFELAEAVYYKHALTLLSLAPVATSDSFIEKYSQGLSPLRLLPSLMQYEKTRSVRISVANQGLDGGGVEETKSTIDYVDINECVDGFESMLELQTLRVAASFVDDPNVTIRYLEGVINQGCRNSAILNYVVSLLVKLVDEEPLYDFLTKHIQPASSGIDEEMKAMISGDRIQFRLNETSSPLDISYALRAVLDTGRHFRSAIRLYMGFGMRQQAVELALKVDPTLARQLAQDSVDLDERKRLWLMIAKSAATGGNGGKGGNDVVSRVVSVLRDCGPDVLSIEDVLPFLPDFAQIDQIKAEICEALTSYSSRIESLLREMKDCDAMCSHLRDDVHQLRHHNMHIKADAVCAFTGISILKSGEPFYVFPSGYVVLQRVLKEVVLPYLKDKPRQRVVQIVEGLQAPTDNSVSQHYLQIDLDGILGSECPLTGSIMVDSIDREFSDCIEMHEVVDAIDRADV